MNNPWLHRVLTLAGELIGFPRHLSQHPGGFVMSDAPLDTLVPVENASMAERTVIQWDKDDLDAVGMLKVDVLALGMLSALRRTFDLLRQHRGRDLTLASIPPDDEPTYEMISRADTVGVFQIESRAQMAMLPRLRPPRASPGRSRRCRRATCREGRSWTGSSAPSSGSGARRAGPTWTGTAPHSWCRAWGAAARR